MELSKGLEGREQGLTEGQFPVPDWGLWGGERGGGGRMWIFFICLQVCCQPPPERSLLQICLTHSASPGSSIAPMTQSGSINVTELAKEQLGARSQRA